MLPTPLRFFLLFHGRICHFGLLFQTPFCKWRWFKWRWRRRWHRTAATATATSSTRHKRLRHFALRGVVSCAEAPRPPVPWQPEQNDRVLAPVVRDLRWSSTRLFPCGNGTVLFDPPLAYDLLLRWQIQRNCLYPNRSKSVRRNGARCT